MSNLEPQTNSIAKAVEASQELYEIRNKREWDIANQMIKVVRNEIMMERCINCMMQQDGYCHTFKTSIPEEHLYSVTECMHHEEDIPF